MRHNSKVLTVDLGDRAYPIYIGSGLLANADLIRAHVKSRQLLVVTNDRVGPLYLDSFISTLSHYQVTACVLPDGERHKNLEVLNRIFDSLLSDHLDRSCTLIALGGGVIGDMTGFAAACYQRGVNFVQVPTTLLAQVDSSVGGKTGVNHQLGKNMIGAFHQPLCVIADTDTLNTLPDRELSAGLAEVIKYGLINDLAFFEWLESNMGSLLNRDVAALTHAIERSCADKAAIVAADEKEAGQRALLNLGHTFGHAIEAEQGYGNWLHGEAVGAGMAMAADLSLRLGWLSPSDKDRIDTLISRACLPTRSPEGMSAEAFMERMAVDKKAIDGKVRFVLLKGIGHAVITSDFDQEKLQETLNAC